ncbi:uncharacterized protein [Atheta coriaria]|uniref:uncharacterized protein n=1 Tax=Dalotia coriaria TaxID=877792 RepID=UPI0031F44E77
MILTTIISLLTSTDQPVKTPINKMAFKLTIALALFAVIYGAQANELGNLGGDPLGILTNLAGNVPIVGDVLSSVVPSNDAASTDPSVSTTPGSALGGLGAILSVFQGLGPLGSILAVVFGLLTGLLNLSSIFGSLPLTG